MEATNSENETSRRASCLGLPYEIRLQIHEYLVQKGCIFIVGALCQMYRDRCSILKIVSSATVRRQLDICALMMACRQVKGEVYATLYGDNTFIFKVGRPRESAICTMVSLEDPNQAQTRTVDCTSTTLWPLTEESLRYAKRVFLAVHPYQRHGKSFRQGYGKTYHGVEKAADLLTGATKLKNFEVLLMPHDARGLIEVAIRDGGSRGFSATLGIQERAGSLTTAQCRDQFVLEPLTQLYDIGDVSVRGAVWPEFAKKLQLAMAGKSPIMLPPRPPAERTQRVLRRRKPGGKRRRVEYLGSEYWRPRYDWVLERPDENTRS